MNDKAPDSSALVVVEPVEPDTSEEEARSKDFAALMAEVRALKPGDVAGVQDLLYKAAGKAARDKITPLQAQMTWRDLPLQLKNIHTSRVAKSGV